MTNIWLEGSLTALITPMNLDGSLDVKAFEKFVDWQIQEGTSALVPVGTTGESPTLSHEEHKKIVEIAVKVSGGRVPVLAGAGSNCTDEAIEMAKFAKEIGANAALVVTPYYNKPTQEGLFLHYTAIANEAEFPIYIYNIPGRSVIDMSVETMARLAENPYIVGVKDATANLVRPIQERRAIKKRFNLLSGEDGTAVSYLAAGGNGCISVTANVAPKLCAEMHKAWKNGNVSEAIALQDLLSVLHDAMFCESNPAPVKYAASVLGLTNETCRLPLAPITEASREKVNKALKTVGLIG
ncbi:4-hydroxy-tetrahydrodipicolinate synthase/N-acetylneuraminate lyase (DapA) (PDB:2R91) (PUBMED:27574185) [Commensalibacter communis]|uniref:4-hydroxy-tetrahydrodipicolinate synthase n=1 Tax=Commensalibacter communis TaxID=2972786 RepID=A0A9W4XHE3_9PROT|nr:4-hydroxy-tetrahydrodipicolinate synthase [Commensalibacter communis]CAI3923431.1 4-hydroxy-tetrahydrodipicolinate synthase/N-acetylneuraminate lyase (DapA) (PDB:2R91) (PUBMED:27574185) [Commensalibacter communis]CAI3927392.1 4-hydroxy-tetrahydrodipicolinate synthase/N-acetylneuraminate lyase (DapA) (PDB:2R91) (PUBMED:27574185) [Commensalibacter communis]CAI3927990.1 4-hydroxy-tetrahydrodipicolinate synthase/N-acetylneuraminate lyase (DapA) (PDB:2R91) (PUBMED:27574185) [Commensalibacter commu